MMFGTKQLFRLGLFIGGTVFGTAGITILRSRDTKCVYTHATTAMLRGRGCVMKTISALHENYDDVYKDTKDPNGHRYAADAERVYQKAETLVEEHGTATKAWDMQCAVNPDV